MHRIPQKQRTLPQKGLSKFAQVRRHLRARSDNCHWISISAQFTLSGFDFPPAFSRLKRAITMRDPVGLWNWQCGLTTQIAKWWSKCPADKYQDVALQNKIQSGNSSVFTHILWVPQSPGKEARTGDNQEQSFAQWWFGARSGHIKVYIYISSTNEIITNVSLWWRTARHIDN